MALISSGTSGDKIAAGTTSQRPGSLTNTDTGLIRFSKTTGHPEAYTGTAGGWKTIEYVGTPETLPGNLTLSGNVTADSLYYVNDLTINNSTTITPKGGFTEFFCTGNVSIGDSCVFLYQDKGAPAVGNSSQSEAGVNGLTGVGLTPGTCGIDVKTPIAPISSLTGSSGSSGKKDPTRPGGTSAGNLSGAAGGTIYIHAVGDITLGASCQFNVNGSNANKNPTAGTGSGSGGGSGGFIVIQAGGSLTIPATCRFYAKGGRGGNGSTNNLTTSSARGGGGGGGGYIIFGARNGTYAVAAGITKDLAGGDRGNNSGSDSNSAARAGGGGSCGGQGGHLSKPLYRGEYGQDGQFLADFIIS